METGCLRVQNPSPHLCRVLPCSTHQVFSAVTAGSSPAPKFSLSLAKRLPSSPTALPRVRKLFGNGFCPVLFCKPRWGGGRGCSGLSSSFTLSPRRFAKPRGDTRGSSPSGDWPGPASAQRQGKSSPRKRGPSILLNSSNIKPWQRFLERAPALTQGAF